MNIFSKWILKVFPTIAEMLTSKTIDSKTIKKKNLTTNTLNLEKYKGTDIGAYHKRYNIKNKINLIHNFINKSNIITVADVGCNSGAKSKNLTQQVTGYDLTTQKE